MIAARRFSQKAITKGRTNPSPTNFLETMGGTKASKPASKTKLLATRRKVGGGPVFKAKTEGKPADVLLGQMMEQYLTDNESAPSYASIMSFLGMNDRNTPWRKAWKEMSSQGLTEQVESGGFFTSGFHLTELGRDEASTEELKELMSKTAATSFQPTTDEELHTHIKSKLMNKRGEEIFDLLLKNGPMSRKELSQSLGISDTGAYFSYALQQLKDLGYAENIKDGGRKTKVTLTDKSFFVKPGKERSIKKE